MPLSVTRIGDVVIGCGVLVGGEPRDIDGRRVARHRDELVTGDEAPTSTQRDQLPDLVAVPGDSERPIVPQK